MKKGFTLVEVLLVVVILAILAGIVLVAINPARQVSQSNDTQRAADVNAILNAVSQYTVDNRGALPTEIGTATDGAAFLASGTGSTDLCTYLVPTYVAELPIDPTAAGTSYTDCTSYSTAYKVYKDANNRVTVTAPSAEIQTSISVTR